RPCVEPVQAAPQKTETMRRPLLLWLEDRREANLNHQGGKESDDESQHRINPYPHHADLVGEDIAALLRGEQDRHGTLTLDQTADDFHRGSNTMHLSFSNGGFTRLVKALSLLAAGIDFRAGPIHRLDHRLIFFL